MNQLENVRSSLNFIIKRSTLIVEFFEKHKKIQNNWKSEVICTVSADDRIFTNLGLSSITAVKIALFQSVIVEDFSMRRLFLINTTLNP
uniref:Carrier domain-containing protein n=1 Tax=Strongyloides venezuelensis TaxID=75913 RepID=A0A0K0G693_STRVS